MGTLDSREYDRLKGRNFKPYSAGHRAMYEKGVAITQRDHEGGTANIFEAGFGIGWGLEYMLAKGVVNSYVGCEPNADSYNWTGKQVVKYNHEGLWLKHAPFSPSMAEDLVRQGVAPFDVAFCIEVIEHVPMDEQLAFLKGLYQMAPTLFFSTPDIDRVPKEGVRTTAEWSKLLHRAGFRSVEVDRSQWTHLYVCRV